MEQEDEEEEDEAGAAMMPIRGPLPPEEGTWASCVRLLDPVEGATVECLELGERGIVFVQISPAASSCAIAGFDGSGRRYFFFFKVSLALLRVQLPGNIPNLPVPL